MYLNAAAFIMGFAGMEAFSWAFHKYAMHGPLWFIHRTHHTPGKGFVEANDVFSLAFGGAAAWAIYYGLKVDKSWLACVGGGVTLYGALYFVLHDVAIHGRIRADKLTRWPLLARIRRGHKIHHKSLAAKPSSAFGLFYVMDSVFTPKPKSR